MAGRWRQSRLGNVLIMEGKHGMSLVCVCGDISRSKGSPTHGCECVKCKLVKYSRAHVYIESQAENEK